VCVIILLSRKKQYLIWPITQKPNGVEKENKSNFEMHILSFDEEKTEVALFSCCLLAALFPNKFLVSR